MDETALRDFDAPSSLQEEETSVPGASSSFASLTPTAAPSEDTPLPPTATPSKESALAPDAVGDVDAMRESVIAALKSVYDPEIPVDVYELGLIYKAEISDEGIVDIDMTLTAPACPVAEHMPVWVRDAVSAVEGVKEARVNMVFDPPWDPSRMSDEARLMLDMF